MSAPLRIWSIQREHLDEAEFLIEMWTNCNASPKYTLAKLYDASEARLLAHIDGMRIGGQPTLDKLLFPVLDKPDDDEFRTSAAALAVLTGAGSEACERVLQALARSEHPAGVAALVRAFVWCKRSGMIPWLARDLDQVSGAALSGRLRVFEHLRVDAGARLVPYLSNDDVEVRRAAARLARHTAASPVLHALAQAAKDPDAQVRWAAIESALIRELSGAWELVRAEALTLRHRAALEWAAMLGSVAVHQHLFAATPTPELLWAWGLSGRAAAVERALELLDHPKLARQAGEVVCTIAGLSRDDDRFWLDNGATRDNADEALPPLEHDDLDAKLVPPAEAALRLPEPASVRAWWVEQRAKYQPGLRYASGRPLDGTQLCRELEHGSTRVRHARALELAGRTAGWGQLDTRMLASEQLGHVHAFAEQFAGLDCQRSLP